MDGGGSKPQKGNPSQHNGKSSALVLKLKKKFFTMKAVPLHCSRIYGTFHVDNGEKIRKIVEQNKCSSDIPFSLSWTAHLTIHPGGQVWATEVIPDSSFPSSLSTEPRDGAPSNHPLWSLPAATPPAQATIIPCIACGDILLPVLPLLMLARFNFCCFVAFIMSFFTSGSSNAQYTKLGNLHRIGHRANFQW